MKYLPLHLLPVVKAMNDKDIELLEDVTDREKLSDCCGAAVYVIGDTFVCMSCQEYCDATDEE